MTTTDLPFPEEKLAEVPLIFTHLVYGLYPSQDNPWFLEAATTVGNENGARLVYDNLPVHMRDKVLISRLITGPVISVTREGKGK